MDLAKFIDHTVLKAETKVEDIIKLCEEAREYNFAAVCVNPCYVGLAANQLAGSGVKVATVVGFPLGANTTASKVFEAQDAIKNKADEIDMVLNIGAAKTGNWEAVTEDIRQVANAVHAEGKLLKVIVETCLLTEKEKEEACRAVVVAGADYIKTSTGFSTGGATLEDIKLFKAKVGDLGIKASGGVRDRKQAEELIACGATRLGTSGGVSLVTIGEGVKDGLY